MDKKLLQKRLERLEAAKPHLKEKFVGLDEVIGQLIHLVSPWYTMPQIQSRPTVINLFGLTGTGKTALIKELMNFLVVDELTYRIDLGRSGDLSFKDTLEEIYNKRNAEPMVLVLDELQMARTVDEEGKEKPITGSQMIWDLLDTGVISYVDYFRNSSSLFDLHQQLNYMIALGVKAKNGRVVKHQDLYLERMEMVGNGRSFRLSQLEQEKNDASIWFLPLKLWDDIQEELKEDYPTLFEFEDALRKMNERDVVVLVERALKHSLQPKKIDASKSLVIMIGNLDEAYTMSHNTSNDDRASVIRKQSERISSATIKRALLQRFRAEQISRLGNNMIIYPAFGEKEYQDLIKMQLKVLGEQVQQLIGYRSEFENSLIEFLMREGVTPAQGARPLISTINNTVQAAIPHLMLALHNQQELTVGNQLQWRVEESDLIIGCGEHEVYRKALFSLVDRLRSPKRDSKQALIAVHESGHALMCYLLTGEAPVTIVSQGSDPDQPGMVQRAAMPDFLTRKELVYEVAIKLGGMEAERLVYGTDEVTLGSEKDLKQASKMATAAVRHLGMGSRLAYFSDAEAFKDSTIPPDQQIYDETQKIINEALVLTRGYLKARKSILVQLASYLSDHSVMSEGAFLSFVEEKGIQPLHQRYDYRKSLKGQAEVLDSLVMNANDRSDG